MSPDQAPHPQAMDSLDVEFFLEDLSNFTHITVSTTNSLVHFSVYFTDSNSPDDREIVYKLS